MLDCECIEGFGVTGTAGRWTIRLMIRSVSEE